MTRRAAVFSCLGLGDGLIALVLSNNLKESGLEVTTFHPSLSSLQGWFPGLPIRPFPDLEELAGFDQIFIVFERSPQMGAVICECERKYPEKTRILNPIATENRDYPYWDVGRFDGRRPFAENLTRFCQDILHLKGVKNDPGIVPPSGVILKKYPNRVVIHPASSRPGKSWLKDRFEALARLLQKGGYDPVFVMSAQERVGWEGWKFPLFDTFAGLALFVAESGSMIGNDSGIGHLASALGLPTVTLCRTRHIAAFWRPSWSQGVVLTPSPLVPNLKGMRLRDKYWKELITTKRVHRAFEQITRMV